LEEEEKTVNANLKLYCKSATPLYATIYLKNTHGMDATNDLYSSCLLNSENLPHTTVPLTYV
jgi:hypothetical protein